MADTIKCPNCSANLFFEPSSGKLECAYCGGSFDPATFQKAVDELSHEAEPAEKKVPEAEEVKEAQDTGDTEQTPETEEPRESDDDNLVTEDAKDTQQFVCKSCGGTIVTSLNTSASFCPFCGSPALIGERLTGELTMWRERWSGETGAWGTSWEIVAITV